MICECGRDCQGCLGSTDLPSPTPSTGCSRILGCDAVGPSDRLHDCYPGQRQAGTLDFGGRGAVLGQSGRGPTSSVRERDHIEAATPPQPETVADRIEAAATAQDLVLGGPMTRMLRRYMPGCCRPDCGRTPRCGDGARRGGRHQHGMLYNVTTQMDLDLWRVGIAAAPYRSVFLANTEELAERFHRGDLPEIGLRESSPGTVTAAQPRSMLECRAGQKTRAGLRRPGWISASGGSRAGGGQTGQRAASRGGGGARSADWPRHAYPAAPGAALAGFLLRRSRELAGLRELPKFVWLSVAGGPSAASAGWCDSQCLGQLQQADDVMFLTLDEAKAAAEGSDQRELAASRRVDHERETRRTRVPGLLLSDRTNAGKPSRRHRAPRRQHSGWHAGRCGVVPAAPGSSTTRRQRASSPETSSSPPPPTRDGPPCSLPQAAWSPRPVHRWRTD